MESKDGAVWFASYPKSGNTWLRTLIEAYRCNGHLDLNDLRVTSSDGGATLIRGVSPIPLEALGFHGQMLLRPAALLNLFCRLSAPLWIKTHSANIQPTGLPPMIPAALTKKAVYVVRDPRSVVLSLSRFFQYSLDGAIDAMNNKEFRIGDNKEFSSIMVSSWSNHVASWTGEKEFPVHVVKYEDMMEDAGRELREVLEFLELKIDEERVEKAVEATKIGLIQQRETEEGFRENVGLRGKFFGTGGTRWKEELGETWVKQIEADHGEVMKLLGYL